MKPIWIYGIQLWGSAAKSSINIIEQFQENTIRTIVDVSWYAPSTIIQKDKKVTTVKDKIKIKPFQNTEHNYVYNLTI